MALRSVESPIVVGVDGSAAARQAVRWSAGEAARRRCGLRVVHAHRWPTSGPRSRYAAWYGQRRALLDRARRWVDEGVDLARTVAPEVPTDGDVRIGSAVELLTEESRSARVVAIGATSRGGPAGLWEGTTAVTLAAHGHCPVVVVQGLPNRSVERSGPVAVGVDRSAAREAAMGFAFDVAALHGVPLVAVRTRGGLRAEGRWFALGAPHGVDADDEWLLDRQLAAWQEKYPDVPVRRLTVPGRPARSLLDRTAGAALLVLGSRRRGVPAALVGSTRHAVLHRSDCPVAIVGAGR